MNFKKNYIQQIKNLIKLNLLFSNLNSDHTTNIYKFNYIESLDFIKNTKQFIRILQFLKNQKFSSIYIESNNILIEEFLDIENQKKIKKKRKRTKKKKERYKIIINLNKPYIINFKNKKNFASLPLDTFFYLSNKNPFLYIYANDTLFTSKYFHLLFINRFFLVESCNFVFEKNKLGFYKLYNNFSNIQKVTFFFFLLKKIFKNLYYKCN